MAVEFGDSRLPERFWSKVQVNPETGCWEWQACKNWKGYGLIQFCKRLQIAHRVAFKELVGPIPIDFQCDHLCRVRACVNPNHLELVTPRENVLRGTGSSAQRARQTHCKAGHEFTPENTFRGKDGFRQCRTCIRRREEERLPRRRAAYARRNSRP